MEHKTFLTGASLISCVAWLAMGSRANTLAHATSIKPRTISDTYIDNLRKELIKSIASGCQIALDQCRDDFKWERWNCPENEFARRYELPATREMAYVAAITAAGITYSTARSCARGHMSPECRCRSEREGGGTAASWDWENCGSDLKAGQRVSELFLRSLEGGAQDIRAQANSHNYRLGRKAVELESEEDCKCHGMSGSCTTRTCWGRVAPFPKVGRILKEKYQKALRVAANGHSKPIQSESRLNGELVFLEDSPDYCKPNATTDWPGTEGRVCSRRKTDKADKSERRSCRELCRSCGHQVRRRPLKTVWRCNCTFQWCCNVTCSTCTKTEHESYCDGRPSLIRRRSIVLHKLT